MKGAELEFFQDCPSIGFARVIWKMAERILAGKEENDLPYSTTLKVKPYLIWKQGNWEEEEGSYLNAIFRIYPSHNLEFTLRIPASTKKILDAAFCDCSFTHIVFENRDDTLYLGPMCFTNCQKLEEVILPANVEMLDSRPLTSAFSHCYNLKKVSLNGRFGWIDPEVFAACPEATSTATFKASTLSGDVYHSKAVQFHVDLSDMHLNANLPTLQSLFADNFSDQDFDVLGTNKEGTPEFATTLSVLKGFVKHLVIIFQ